jgi:hypothetical protein
MLPHGCSALTTGRRDDRDLAGERVAAADAVDLARVRRAHHRQQQGVPFAGIGGQVTGEEVRPLGRTSAQDHDGNSAQLAGAESAVDPPAHAGGLSR